MQTEKTESVVHECPFPDCDWSHEYTDLVDGHPIDDCPTAVHYERHHAGRARILATLEFEQMIGGRTTDQISEHIWEKLEEEGYEVAWTRTEVLEEADDHSKLRDM